MRKWGKTPSEFFDLPEYDRVKMVEAGFHFKEVLERAITQSKRKKKGKKGQIMSEAKADPELVKIVLPFLFEMM